MRWFEGAITAAITEAKKQRVLFVVYIYGKKFILHSEIMNMMMKLSIDLDS